MAGIKKGAELRQKIIDTAWGLFYENGYENTTVNDIIRKVGTSKGGFYYYFKAKEDLLNSLYSVFDREYEKFYENKIFHTQEWRFYGEFTSGRCHNNDTRCAWGGQGISDHR